MNKLSSYFMSPVILTPLSGTKESIKSRVFVDPSTALRMTKCGYVSFVIILLSCLSLSAQTPGARGRGIPEVENLSAEEASQRLLSLRHQRLSGDFVFLFELKHMPKRGKSIKYEGTLWGSWNARGPVMRLFLREEGGDKDIVRLLVQSGSVPEAWLFYTDGNKLQLLGNDLYEPLISGLNYSAFDLMMAFIYWDDFTYEESKRVKGQASHIFNMRPPEFMESTYGFVRMALHAGYNAPIQAEMYNLDSELIRTLKILSFKKAQGEWIIKSADLLDELTHDKTRFKVAEAEIGIIVDESLFTPMWTGEAPSTEGYGW